MNQICHLSLASIFLTCNVCMCMYIVCGCKYIYVYGQMKKREGRREGEKYQWLSLVILSQPSWSGTSMWPILLAVAFSNRARFSPYTCRLSIRTVFTCQSEKLYNKQLINQLSLQHHHAIHAVPSEGASRAAASTYLHRYL